MPKLRRQKKELQNWGYYCTSGQCFKKPLPYGKNRMGEWPGNKSSEC